MKNESYFIPERTRLEALYKRRDVLASPALLKRSAAHLTLVLPKTVHVPRHVQKSAQGQLAFHLEAPLRFEGIAKLLAQACWAKALSVFDEEGLLLSEYPAEGSLQSRLTGMHCLWPSDWKSLAIETASGEFLYWVTEGLWVAGLLAGRRLSVEQIEGLRLKLCGLQEALVSA